MVPTFLIESNVPTIAAVKPYSPLELEGRDIYIKEGCVGCHSQMVRPFRSETERYGHYSLAGESVYDHPFLWGSKRTGPDLARVGERYSDSWHIAHLINPRDVVPESNMPAYPYLNERTLDGALTRKKMETLNTLYTLTCPKCETYSEEELAAATEEVNGKTEMDAIVAYLQGLGTAVKMVR